MEDRILKYLYDILIAAQEIEAFFGGVYDFTAYKNNKLLKYATERQLITIGEATNRVLALNANISISSARQIVQFRNKITHEYDAIEDENVWSIIVRHLPILKTEVEGLIFSIQNPIE